MSRDLSLSMLESARECGPILLYVPVTQISSQDVGQHSKTNAGNYDQSSRQKRIKHYHVQIVTKWIASENWYIRA